MAEEEKEEQSSRRREEGPVNGGFKWGLLEITKGRSLQLAAGLCSDT
jgi:hypothetical protein